MQNLSTAYKSVQSFWQNLLGGYRYGFNGKESDGEISGEKNSYDFGALFYNPRVGRFLSLDPMEQNFPWQSPYIGFDNSPITKKDVEGKSAIVTIDKTNKTITVSSNIIMFGPYGSQALAAQSAKDIETQYNNAANGYFVNIDGQQYSVTFDISGEYRTDLDMSAAISDKNLENNYIYVDLNANNPEGVSYTETTVNENGGNTGYWSLENIDGANTTTEAHEYGHSIGLDHPPSTNFIGQGQPGIMAPRGSAVDAQYTYDPSKGQTTETNQNTLDPNKRVVLPSDLNNLENEVTDHIKSKQFTTNTDGTIVVGLGTLTNESHEE